RSGRAPHPGPGEPGVDEADARGAGRVESHRGPALKGKAVLLPLASLLLGCSRSPAPPPSDVRPTIATQPVGQDPDDPAIWVNPPDATRSLILGTNKVAAPNGALVVFGLDGKIRQTIAGLDRPNNVDVEYSLLLPGGPVDIAVATERLQRRLRI